MALLTFDEIKARVHITDILSNYFDKEHLQLPQDKTQLRLPCIICDYDGRSFSVNIEKNIFKCFHCPAQGNVLNLVAAIENTDVANAARILNDQYPQRQTEDLSKSAKLAAKCKPRTSCEDSKTTPEQEETPYGEPNQPLNFDLKGIDPYHESVSSLALDCPERIGIGYYSGKGKMKDSIVCPIQNRAGSLLGYCKFINKNGCVSVEYPGEKHFQLGSDLFCTGMMPYQMGSGEIHLFRSPYDAVCCSLHGYTAVAFMGEIPGKMQIDELYDLYSLSDAYVTYHYATADSAELIGRTVLALKDVSLLVASV